MHDGGFAKRVKVSKPKFMLSRLSCLWEKGRKRREKEKEKEKKFAFQVTQEEPHVYHSSLQSLRINYIVFWIIIYLTYMDRSETLDCEEESENFRCQREGWKKRKSRNLLYLKIALQLWKVAQYDFPRIASYLNTIIIFGKFSGKWSSEFENFLSLIQGRHDTFPELTYQKPSFYPAHLYILKPMHSL